MTKEEFWQKWIIDTSGQHVPVRVLERKKSFFSDLDLLIYTDIDKQINTPGRILAKVPAFMQGLGHQWNIPSPECFETALYICASCGVTSENKKCEEKCENPIGG